MTIHELEPPPNDGYTEHVPPNDIAAERAALAGMLIDPRVIQETLDAAPGTDYYRTHHELIRDAIAHLHDQGEPVDTITVTSELRARGVLKRVGGAAYIHELAGSVITGANAAHYADIVHEQAALRRLDAAGLAIRSLVANPGDGNIADLYDTAATTLETARARVITDSRAPDSSWAPVDLAAIIEHGDIVNPPTILPRTDGICLLYPGAVHSCSGEPESGKTWVALYAIATELLKGEEAAIVDFEDRPGRIVARLINLGVPPDTIRARFHYIRPTDALTPTAALMLDDLFVRCTTVILDGITEAMSLHGFDLNDMTDTAAWLALLPRRIADLGPAVLQIDHVPKNTDEHNRFALGSGHKLAGLDGAAYMVKVIEPFGRGKTGRARITISKDRDGSVREHATGHTIAELVLDSDAETHALRAALETPRGTRPGDSTFRPTVLMERVSDYLERCTEPVSATTIERNVTGKATVIRTALQALVMEGYVNQLAGNRGPEYTHENTYKESTDDRGSF